MQSMSGDELYEKAKNLQVLFDLIKYVNDKGQLPVPNFSVGGVATPADAGLMLGAQWVFVGSGIFKSCKPAKRADAIVKSINNPTDYDLIARLSEDLGEPIGGINCDENQVRMEERGK